MKKLYLNLIFSITESYSGQLSVSEKSSEGSGSSLRASSPAYAGIQQTEKPWKVLEDLPRGFSEIPASWKPAWGASKGMTIYTVINFIKSIKNV